MSTPTSLWRIWGALIDIHAEKERKTHRTPDEQFETNSNLKQQQTEEKAKRKQTNKETKISKTLAKTAITKPVLPFAVVLPRPCLSLY